MKKLLSLDIGQKRIGVAIAEGSLIAPYGVIENSNLNDARRHIGKICRKENIFKIIIGIPRSMDTIQTDKIHKFALELAKNLYLEVDFVDETLTSKEAERQLKDQNLDPKSRRYKEEVDKLSAKFILEQYLQENPNS